VKHAARLRWPKYLVVAALVSAALTGLVVVIMFLTVDHAQLDETVGNQTATTTTTTTTTAAPWKCPQGSDPTPTTLRDGLKPFAPILRDPVPYVGGVGCPVITSGLGSVYLGPIDIEL
jgi:hypothetical protein